MKPGGSNKKGGQFERATCRDLSLWVSEGLHLDLFWRTAMSGGRATLGRRRGEAIRQGGDVCTVADEGFSLTNRFHIECKHMRNLDIGAFFTRGTGRLAKFWRIAVAEAALAGREPMLIAKQNFMKTIVITSHIYGAAHENIVFAVVNHRSVNIRCAVCDFETLVRKTHYANFENAGDSRPAPERAKRKPISERLPTRAPTKTVAEAFSGLFSHIRRPD